eukprot:4661017-Amphidinium_carterae.1
MARSLSSGPHKDSCIAAVRSFQDTSTAEGTNNSMMTATSRHLHATLSHKGSNEYSNNRLVTTVVDLDKGHNPC